jgi:hypothetical protein
MRKCLKCTLISKWTLKSKFLSQEMLLGQWHACPEWKAGRFPWHVEFTALQIFLLFFIFCPTAVSILWIIFIFMCLYIYTHTHTHTHISECVQTVYELPLLPNNTAVKHCYKNRERCEVLTGYLPLGRRPGGDWINTWHWTKGFTILFSNRKQYQPQLLPNFLT